MHENVHQNVFFFFFFFFFLLFKSNLINSEIQSFKIITDSRPLIMFEDFGFNNPGYISISISSISITTRSMNPTNSSLMGCFYAPSPARRAMKLALLNDYCIIGKPFIFPIFVFNERTLLSQSSINKTIPVTIPDLYYIFFLNCAKTSSISMNVDLETYNIKPNGDPYYTDEHFTNLPSTLFTFSFLFFVFLLIWLRLCIKNKYFLHRIHILMALLLFFRFLDLFSYAKTQHVTRLTGLSHGWNVLWLVVYFVKNILFVNVIVLIGAGWSLLRPCLQEFHKYVLSIAVSLQILVNLCFVLMRGFGPSNEHYRYWVVTYYAVDFICCVTMLLPVFKSIDDLGVNSKTEGKEARKLAQLKIYGNYALAIHAYVGFTRLGMFALRCITSYKLLCVTIALELAIEFLFYVIVYLMFCPNERNDFVVVGDREDDCGSIAGHGFRSGC